MEEQMPVLFIGHGSPMNVILDNDFTKSLADWGKRLPRPRAIMVISAHWLTAGTFVTCAAQPRTIHDFYGFSQELYELTYPCPGSPDEAQYVAGLMEQAKVGCNYDWGLDHGAWTILRHLYPAADLPVFQMSLDYSFLDWHPKPVQYHFDLAKELSALRKRGILIIGSGNIVHNLSKIDFRNIDARPFVWAAEADEKVKANLLAGNHEELINFPKMGKSVEIGIPTLDHYLPMIYTIALQQKDEPLSFFYEGLQHGSVSMRCFQIG